MYQYPYISRYKYSFGKIIYKMCFKLHKLCLLTSLLLADTRPNDNYVFVALPCTARQYDREKLYISYFYNQLSE